MAEIKAVIVDDEADSREVLSRHLAMHCPAVQPVGFAASASEAYELVVNKEPQLVFLDISMPGGDGFELLQRFTTIPFETIFITAYDHYAIQAIRLSAVDYILKPVNVELLKNAVQKAIASIDTRQNRANLKHLIGNLDHDARRHKIALPTAEGFVYVHVSEITHCQADGSYTWFYFTSRKSILVSRNLKEYEEMLEPYHFFRVHHSYLVNIFYVASYHKGRGGYIVMNDTTEINVAQRRRDDFLALLSKRK